MSLAVILASQSASRRAMLDAAGLSYMAVPSNVDEAQLKQALLAERAKPRDIADALAEMKALRVAQHHPGALVIGSDSIVLVNGQLFDKPVSRANAADHLAAFSGREMQLVSAVVVVDGGRPVWRHVEIARMQVRLLSPTFIDAYLDAEWPAIAGCVGCFRIEARGVQLFDAIKGDHFTILGMPLLPLLAYLRLRGAMTS